MTRALVSVLIVLAFAIAGAARTAADKSRKVASTPTSRPASLDPGGAPSAPVTDEQHTKWIAEAMREIGTIKPGITRAELLKVFTTEGGLSTRTQRQYVWHRCPYIKVDVRFRPAKNENERLKEDPADIIVEISRPYLQWSILD
jgi:hypothetical protein